MDTLTQTQRSLRMALIRNRDTEPEHVVRRLIHGLGYRYRLHDRKLPGCPDLVFKQRYKIIFVHGCFWHRHPRCKLARLPKSKLGFWVPKLEANRDRDKKVLRKLRHDGWKVLVIWECQLADLQKIGTRVREFLGSQ